MKQGCQGAFDRGTNLGLDSIYRHVERIQEAFMPSPDSLKDP